MWTTIELLLRSTTGATDLTILVFYLVVNQDSSVAGNINEYQLTTLNTLSY